MVSQKVVHIYRYLHNKTVLRFYQNWHIDDHRVGHLYFKVILHRLVVFDIVVVPPDKAYCGRYTNVIKTL